MPDELRGIIARESMDENTREALWAVIAYAEEARDPVMHVDQIHEELELLRSWLDNN